jgi:CheY-specific phosphatase CheX
VSAKFFGQFLLEKGLITPDLVLRAAHRQSIINLKVGERAVKEGWMTTSQVKHVLDKQRSADKLFGELCVLEKFLTQAQVTTLLEKQKAEHQMFGQVLVGLNAMAPSAIERALAQYKAELPAEENIPAGLALRLPHGKQMREVAHLTHKLLRRVGGVIGKPGVANVMNGSLERVDLEVWTSFKGTFDCRYLLRMPKVLSMQMALCFSGGQARSASEVIDSVLEFTNVVAGNYCADLDAQGHECKIAPPEFSADGAKPVVMSGPYALFPFYTTFGELQLVFEPRALPAK